MDQKSLYELHSGPAADVHQALLLRDEFVVTSILSALDGELSVAEISVGSEQLAAQLLRSARVRMLTFADISPEKLDRIRGPLDPILRMHGASANFVQCNFDSEFGHLPSASFDAVIALDVMEHVFDVFSFMDHCARIVKPGGMLFVRVPNIAYVRHRLSLLFGRLPVTAGWFGPRDDLAAWRATWGWDGGHLHLFTIPILTLLMAQSGFDVVSCRDPGTRFSRVRDLWPQLLYSNPLMTAVKKREALSGATGAAP